MQVINDNCSHIPLDRLCSGFGIGRSTFYRWKNPPIRSSSRPPGDSSHRALSPEEKQTVLSVLHSERFWDQSPSEVYYTLLDEGVYLCSKRTMYRILSEQGESRERRKQAEHPPYVPPRLMADQPNRVWSWDITKVAGAGKREYYQIYVMIDIFSRFVVGWMVAARESAELAKHFIEETCALYGIRPGCLTIHADRGTSMRSKPVAFLLADLGITKTHSRPRVSNDNPYSESQFKTMKYRPDFPERFGSLEDARAFCQEFFQWYNYEHRHSGIGYLTPAAVHKGETKEVQAQRQAILNSIYQLHPERFVKKPPTVSPVPEQVWINRPQKVLIPDEEIPHDTL